MQIKKNKENSTKRITVTEAGNPAPTSITEKSSLYLKLFSYPPTTAEATTK